MPRLNCGEVLARITSGPSLQSWASNAFPHQSPDLIRSVCIFTLFQKPLHKMKPMSHKQYSLTALKFIQMTKTEAPIYNCTSKDGRFGGMTTFASYFSLPFRQFMVPHESGFTQGENRAAPRSSPAMCWTLRIISQGFLHLPQIEGVQYYGPLPKVWRQFKIGPKCVRVDSPVSSTRLLTRDTEARVGQTLAAANKPYFLYTRAPWQHRKLKCLNSNRTIGQWLSDSSTKQHDTVTNPSIHHQLSNLLTSLVNQWLLTPHPHTWLKTRWNQWCVRAGYTQYLLSFNTGLVVRTCCNNSGSQLSQSKVTCSFKLPDGPSPPGPPRVRARPLAPGGSGRLTSVSSWS